MAAVLLPAPPLIDRLPAQAVPLWRAVPVGPVIRPPDHFARVLDATVNAVGTVFVLDGREPHLRVFSPSGTMRKAFGRRGQGPGEFQGPRRLGWKRDTLWIADPGLQRVTLFTGATTVLRTVAPVGRGPTSFPIGLADNGAVLLISLGGAGGSFTEDLRFIRFLSDDPLRDAPRPIALIGATTTQLRVPTRMRGAPGELVTEQPFSDDPRWQVSRDGNALVIVEPRVGMKAGEALILITQVGWRGDTIFVRSLPYRPRALDDATFARTLDGLRKRGQSVPGMAVEIEPSDLRRSVHRPRNLPPVSGVVPAVDGSVWIRREEHAGSADVEYLVLHRSGVPAGMLRLPREDRVLEARDTMLWAVNTDSDGNETIRSYQVLK